MLSVGSSLSSILLWDMYHICLTLFRHRMSVSMRFLSTAHPTAKCFKRYSLPYGSKVWVAETVSIQVWSLLLVNLRHGSSSMRFNTLWQIVAYRLVGFPIAFLASFAAVKDCTTLWTTLQLAAPSTAAAICGAADSAITRDIRPSRAGARRTFFGWKSHAAQRS